MHKARERKEPFLTMRSLARFLCVFINLFLLAGCDQSNPSNDNTANGAVPVNIGWQIPLATQGQIIQVLKEEQHLETAGYNPNFIAFSFGSPAVEAALAGEVDLIIAGDQPAVSLISASSDWIIISRLFYTKVSVLVPLNSEISSPSDLIGRTIVSPFGSVAHREAYHALSEIGLDPSSANHRNMDSLELIAMIQNANGENWPGVDAVVIWEPSATLFPSVGLARSIRDDNALVVALARNGFLESNPKFVKDWNTAWATSWLYFNRHRDEANRLYLRASNIKIDSKLLDEIALTDPNSKATDLSQVSVKLDSSDLLSLNQALEWGHDEEFIRSKPDLAERVHSEALKPK